jgi:hypothetical protein
MMAKNAIAIARQLPQARRFRVCLGLMLPSCPWSTETLIRSSGCNTQSGE